MANDYFAQLTQGFSETISEKVLEFFQNNKVLQAFRNSDGNYSMTLEKIPVGDGTVDVRATFIHISSNNYKCSLELLNFPKIFDGRVKVVNKYEGSLFLCALHEQPKSINLIK